MPRRWIGFILTICAGVGLWVVIRPTRPAAAATDKPVLTQEIAEKRWMTNQPNHWRRILVHR
ncbi:MAG: hypothetical protein ACRCZF_24125 [Gemmataceae bacterium]